MDTLAAVFSLPLRAFDVDVALDVGQTLALVGPSGAGKSSVLRAIAGLARPVHGRIAVGDNVWFDTDRRVDLAPEDRRVGFVFQEYALFPHLSVRQNVEFGGRERAQELLERFRIAHLDTARPAALSGGERQRVALARAIARDPRVLLLDEPLSALDAHTRATVRSELREVLRSLDRPALLVTHDFEDAAALADTVGVLVDGRVRQLASPQELVARPADAFVASLTGANLMSGRVTSRVEGLTELRLDDGAVVFSIDAIGSGPVAAIVYPWEVTLSREAPGGSMHNHVQAKVTSVVDVANRVRVTVGPVTAEVTPDSALRLDAREGEVLVASWKATATRLVRL